MQMKSLVGKAALNAEQLSDRACRGQRQVEIHTNEGDLDRSPRQAQKLLAQHGIRAVSVHAPIHAHLGNLDRAVERQAVNWAMATAVLADGIMPPGEVRLVPIHLAPTTSVRELAAGGNRAVRDRRRRELEIVTESAMWLAENCHLSRGPVRFCLENHALFEPGYWDPATPRFAHTFCSGRFLGEFAFLAHAVCSQAPEERLGFTLDVCHAMSALAGARLMKATGERFALVLPEDLEGALTLEDWFAVMGPWLSVVHVSKAVGLAGDPGQHGTPLRDTDIDLALQVCDCLTRVGFAGPVVLEIQEPNAGKAEGTTLTAEVLKRAIRLYAERVAA